LLAKTEPTPPGVNFSIVLFPWFATKRLPWRSNARAAGAFKPLVAKTELMPSGVNF
jgi:hypothetical protein